MVRRRVPDSYTASKTRDARDVRIVHGHNRDYNKVLVVV